MKVIETVRERFSCRNCETITQPPAPFHVTPRGMFGPQLLASILFDKYGMHQPLNRQCDRYAREGVEIALSTMADQVGAAMVALKPLHMLMETHVCALAPPAIANSETPQTRPLLGFIWKVFTRDRADTFVAAT